MKKINQKKIVFSFYYLISCLGLILNYIYGIVHVYPMTNILYLSTIHAVYFGMGIISIFVVGVYYEKKVRKNIPKLQVVFILLYGLLLSGIYFINGAVEINDETNWKPVVNTTFFIYCTCFLISALVIFAFFSYRTHVFFVRTGQERIIVRSWLMFFIGILMTFIFAEITMLNHLINKDTFRELWSVIGGFLLVIGTFLIWFGIGKKFL